MWVLPWVPQSTASGHGAVMMVGFVASIIALERAVTMNEPLLKAAAVAFPLSGLLIAFGIQNIAYFVATFGGLCFLTWSIKYFLSVKERFSGLFFLFAGFFLMMGVLFYVFRFSVTFYVLSWVTFVVCFICGERMDMLRVRNVGKQYFYSAAISLPVALAGVLTTAMELVALFFALLLVSVVPHDLGVKMYKKQGFSRFLSVGLISAYSWLALSVLVWVVNPVWDSMLHVVFLGFVGNMIFTHAPVVFPVVLKSKHFYSKLLYVPFLILQASIIVRLVSARLLQLELWAFSGLMTVIAVALYAFITVLKMFPKKDFRPT